MSPAVLSTVPAVACTRGIIKPAHERCDTETAHPARIKHRAETSWRAKRVWFDIGLCTAASGLSNCTSQFVNGAVPNDQPITKGHAFITRLLKTGKVLGHGLGRATAWAVTTDSQNPHEDGWNFGRTLHYIQETGRPE